MPLINEYYKIITSKDPDYLNTKIKEYIQDGWSTVGGHQVVIKHSQNRYAGTQLKDCINTVEYSQTIKKYE
jgi:hypothetical protein